MSAGFMVITAARASVNPARLRAVAGTADQILSSLSNALILFAVARLTTVAEFGVVVLVFSIITATMAVVRGAVGNPLLMMGGDRSSEIRTETEFGMAAALLVGVGVAAVVLSVATALGQPALGIAFAVAAPFVLVQDVLRFASITAGRPEWALYSDGFWAAGSTVILLMTALDRHAMSPVMSVWGWTGSCIASAVIVIGRLWVMPHWNGMVAWWNRERTMRVRFGIEHGIDQISAIVVVAVSTAFIGSAAAGAVRGASTIMGPFAVLISALPLVIIPEAARSGDTPRQIWRRLRTLALITSLAAAAIGFVGPLLPTALGQLLLGQTWGPASKVLPFLAAEYASLCWLASVMSFLRTQKDSGRLLFTRIVQALTSIVLCTLAAVVFHTAVAVGAALAVTGWLISGWALIILRPKTYEHAPAPLQQSDKPQVVAAAAYDPALLDTVQLWPVHDNPLLAPDESVTVPAQAITAHTQPVTAPTQPVTAPTQPVRTPEAAGHGGALVAVWVAVLLVIVVPALLIRFTPTPPHDTWMGALAVTTLAGARYAWIVGDGHRRLIEMSFWVFTYVFLGMAPLTHLRMQQVPATTPRIDTALNGPALHVVVVGLLMFCAGLLAGGRVSARVQTRAGGGGISTPRAVALAFVALAADAYYLKKVGIGTLFSSRDNAVQTVANIWPDTSMAGLIIATAMMSLLVSFIALTTAWRNGGRRDHALLTLIVIVGIALAVTINPISGARYLFGTAALSIAALFGLFATHTRFRVTAILALVALVAVFPLADAFRYSTSAEFKATSPLEALTSPDYDAFEQINNSLLYVQREGQTNGRQAMGVVFFWVPRRIWPDKPTDTGILLADNRGYNFKNLSAPLWGELYINGAWIALALGMFGLGMLSRVQDRRIELTLRRSRAPALLSCILPFYLIILLRGSLLQAMSYLTVIICCGLFVAKWGADRGMATEQ